MFGKSDGNGRGVVSMTERDKERRLAPVRLIERYWRELAADSGEVPLRSQIDPRGIESALEYAFLGERLAPMLAKLRVAGTHLNDLMGMETGGMPLSALFAPEDRDRLGDAVSKVFGEAALVRIDLRAEEGFGKGALEGHLLLLPLRSDMGDMSRMIGALVTTGRIGRTPRRFRIAGLSVEPALKGVRTRAPSDPRPMPLRPELAESKASFEPAPKRSADRRAPYLKLVISND